MGLENRVKEHRARLNINQSKLGELAHVSRQTISLIERGDYSPSVSLALKLALLFAVVIAMFGDMFFGGGLTAIVLLTACNIIVSIAYCYYTMKLGKGGGKAL